MVFLAVPPLLLYYVTQCVAHNEVHGSAQTRRQCCDILGPQDECGRLLFRDHIKIRCLLDCLLELRFFRSAATECANAGSVAGSREDGADLNKYYYIFPM